MDQENIEKFIGNPDNYSQQNFSFDYVFDQDKLQSDVYAMAAQQSILSVLDVFTIFFIFL